jgi:Ca2+/Na+ antiporter
MNIGSLVGALYLIISGMFAYNFSIIFQRVRSGSKKVNKHSLFATSSLVMIFFAEAMEHMGLGLQWVLVAQAYLLWTMLYIVYSKKNETEEKA